MASTEDTALASPVPVIDLTAGLRVTASVLASIREATETVGVIQVVNHGVPLDLIEYLGCCQREGGRLADDPELRDLAFRYIAAGQSLAEWVLGLYARAYGLPDGTFPVDPLPHLSLSLGAGGDAGRLPSPEPADGSVLTVLAQVGGSAGLEAQRPDGGWAPVPTMPGALPVFSGSLLARWTNGRLCPARYRTTAARCSAAALYYPAFGPVRGPLAPVAGLVADGAENFLKSCCGPAQVAA